MALINNTYVLVTEESIDNTVDTTSHPAEKGLPLSDTVRRQPISVSISGKIVDTNERTAEMTIQFLKNLQSTGSLITYKGQCGTIKSLQIQSFNTKFNHKNNGGADFDMSLKEIRIVQNSFVRKKEPVKETKTTTPKVGDTVKFLGGYVYVSSDAKSPSAKRGASQCVLTKISTLSNRKHIYHLISKDCIYGSPNYVYGWVDASKVSALSKTVSQKSSSGGKQQVVKRLFDRALLQ